MAGARKPTALLLAGCMVAGVPLRSEGEGPSLNPGRHEVTINVGGFDRHYVAHVPKSYEAKRPIPVVLILHGAGGSGSGYLDLNGWAAKAEKENFVAVAPDGLPVRPNLPASFRTNPRVWNTGQLRPNLPRARIDDVAFIKALLADLGRKINVDAHRVYVAGHSNGAGMTFRLGAEISEKFAALGPVASHCWIEDPKPAHPLPTLYVIGTKDPLVPLGGGEIKLPWGNVQDDPPVSQTLTRWAKALGCSTNPKTLSTEGGVTIIEYGSGANGVALTAYFIEGQGHGWPGGKESGLPASLIGPSVDTVNATDLLWEFFKKHSH